MGWATPRHTTPPLCMQATPATHPSSSPTHSLSSSSADPSLSSQTHTKPKELGRELPKVKEREAGHLNPRSTPPPSGSCLSLLIKQSLTPSPICPLSLFLPLPPISPIYPFSLYPCQANHCHCDPVASAVQSASLFLKCSPLVKGNKIKFNLSFFA
ncbi:hypothetical protein CMV_028148 [Castanea mollissima]|uniref:Uncharacterized protein n=1 Tax=Castanea mollissima TaxID=60419 RepID=A0A8J4Q8S2_9ROSI|nr:hypothetical protein CMV_028148 [Castanea mollissima]